LGLLEEPKILKVGDQCFEEEKDKFMDFSVSLRMFFPGPMRIFVVSILVLSIMLFQLRKKQK
jgi:hypothetical protein